MQWTSEQKKAITARGGNLLLSAAAGSGKTTVLVERVLELIREGTNVDEMLICTFTNAAASDMRAKIAKKLRENAGEAVFRAQLDRINLAKIGTLHAFCSELVREHFQLAGIDPNARIADSAEMEDIRLRAFEDALDETLKEPSDGLEMLIFGRDAENLYALVQEIYEFARTQEDFSDFLRRTLIDFAQSDNDAWLLELENTNREALLLGAETAKRLLQWCLDEEELTGFATLAERDYNMLQEACALSIRQLQERKLSFGRLSPTKTETQKKYKEERDSLKKIVGDALNPLIDIQGERERLQKIAPMYRALYDLVLRYHDNLETRKRAKRVMTFDDLEHKALFVLSDENVRKSVQEHFTYVFVDEYQDTSDIQEAVLTRICRGDNRFMVGDVKQSIYRFRGADPELFLEKYAQYGQNEGGRMIALRSNFRSRGTVVEFVNAVFERIMVGGPTQILYDDMARLYPGARYDGDDPKCELLLLSKPDADAEKDDIAEARAAAQRLLEIMEDNALSWRDFCVLARNKETLRVAEDIFTSYGIPCFADVETDFFQSLEVKTVLSLLRLTENRMLDEEWICVLRSALFSFSEEDLTRVRIASPDGSFYQAIQCAMLEDGEIAYRLREASEEIAHLSVLSGKRPIAEVLDDIYRTRGFYAYVGALPGGAQRQTNLDCLLTMAGKFESGNSSGMLGFLRYIEKKIRATTEGISAHALGEGDNVVRLMTVHKSKGLEFPVVFCLRMGKNLLGAGHPEKAQKDRDLGIALPLPDMEKNGFIDLCLRDAILEKQKRLTLNEEMRLLYVALTRAKERLVLVGTTANRDKDTVADCVSTPKTWLQAVLPVVAMREDLCALREIPSGGAEGSSATGANQLFREWLLDPPESKDDYFQKAFSYEYPHRDEVLRPLKMTATGITREVEGPEAIPELTERPLFMTEESMTGAQRGTLTHALLSAIDLKAIQNRKGIELRNILTAAKDEMLERGLLYADCSVNPIAHFFESSMGQRLLSSKEIHREWAFNLSMTTDEALHDGGNTPMLVQGVIDCCFLEDGEWVLLDYKTDRSHDIDTLKTRYAPQLAIYKKALTRITSLPVKETALCVLGNDTIISLKEEELL